MNASSQLPGRMPAGTSEAQDEPEIDLLALLSAARRGWHILLLGTLVGAGLGVANLVTTTPLYTAHVQISIGSSEAADTRALSGVTAPSAAETEITTEMQILRSEKIAERVVENLGLVDNPTFLARPETGISHVVTALRQVNGEIRDFLEARLSSGEIAPLPPSEADEDAAAQLAAISRLRSNMAVGQVERSRVLQVSYTSVSPQLSARIANGIAEAYIDDQMEAKYAASTRATEWLRERSEQLRQQSIRLDNQVELFRQENGLIDAGGELVSDTELERLNQRVSEARAAIIELEARRQRLDDVVAVGDPSVVVSATASQGITSDLRARYLETLRSYNALVSRLGDDHEQTQRRMRELQELQGLMFEEVKRYAEVTRSDLDAARVRLNNLEIAQAAAEERLGTDNAELIQLRELERNAETVRSLYTSFLQRYQQSLQQQEFTISDARILNPARPSGRPSSPEAATTVAIPTLLGFLLAAAWVALLHFRDNKLRSGEQLRTALGLEYLGELPRVRGLQTVTDRSKTGDGDETGRTVALPEILRYAADNPMTNFAETLRAGRMSVKLKNAGLARASVIGLVSGYPGEGKTTVSANLAALLAKQGASVMLIDADLRNPGLTRGLGGDLERGLVDIRLEDADWRDVHYHDPEIGLDIIPNKRGRVVHTSEVIGGQSMERLIDMLASQYDYVILDLPPLGPVVDARAILHKLDGIFFVSAWGETNVGLVQKLLRADPRIQAKCFGAFLNMFDARKARAYGVYGGGYYYGKGYARYYGYGS